MLVAAGQQDPSLAERLRLWVLGVPLRILIIIIVALIVQIVLSSK